MKKIHVLALAILFSQACAIETLRCALHYMTEALEVACPRASLGFEQFMDCFEINRGHELLQYCGRARDVVKGIDGKPLRDAEGAYFTEDAVEDTCLTEIWRVNSADGRLVERAVATGCGLASSMRASSSESSKVSVQRCPAVIGAMPVRLLLVG